MKEHAPAPRYHILLGGHDLEMVEIARLAAECGVPVSDKGLAWGARLSAYAPQIAALAAEGITPVAIELTDDLPAEAPGRSQTLLIDHHGPAAGRLQPTALEQVFRLLEAQPRQWTRWRQLVAANDRGHIKALQEAGAEQEEIEAIRRADRAAQGITVQDEQMAREDLATLQQQGRLTLVQARTRRSSLIADLLHPALGGPGYGRLAVLMPGELACYGDGESISALARHWPAGWWGGALPDSGFFGMSFPQDTREHITREVIRLLSA